MIKQDQKEDVKIVKNSYMFSRLESFVLNALGSNQRVRTSKKLII